jgi:hypothetical protein
MNLQEVFNYTFKKLFIQGPGINDKGDCCVVGVKENKTVYCAIGFLITKLERTRISNRLKAGITNTDILEEIGMLEILGEEVDYIESMRHYNLEGISNAHLTGLITAHDEAATKTEHSFSHFDYIQGCSGTKNQRLQLWRSLLLNSYLKFASKYGLETKICRALYANNAMDLKSQCIDMSL